MKILTVCQRGNTRSVALAYLLKDSLGYDDVLACGVETTRPRTFAMLAKWADKIFVVAELGIFEKVPERFKYKTVNLDIGPDRWGSPFHPELLAFLSNILAVNSNLLK